MLSESEDIVRELERRRKRRERLRRRQEEVGGRRDGGLGLGLRAGSPGRAARRRLPEAAARLLRGARPWGEEPCAPGAEVARLAAAGGALELRQAAVENRHAALPATAQAPEVAASRVCPRFVTASVFTFSSCQICVFSKRTRLSACALCGHGPWEDGSARAAIQEASPFIFRG